MDFRNQGTSSIDDLELSFSGFLADLWRDSMSAENDYRTRGDLIERLDEYGALFGQIVDNMTVMHNFLVHVDGSAKLLNGQSNDFDSADDAGTKASRAKKQ